MLGLLRKNINVEEGPETPTWHLEGGPMALRGLSLESSLPEFLRGLVRPSFLYPIVLYFLRLPLCHLLLFSAHPSQCAAVNNFSTSPSSAGLSPLPTSLSFPALTPSTPNLSNRSSHPLPLSSSENSSSPPTLFLGISTEPPLPGIEISLLSFDKALRGPDPIEAVRARRLCLTHHLPFMNRSTFQHIYQSVRFLCTYPTSHLTPHNYIVLL